MPRLLIVDDEPYTRSVLENVLARDPVWRGVELLSATSGQEGIDLFMEHKPEVVIVDLFMPKTDGFKVCTAIRAKSYGKDTQLLAVSGVYKDAKIAIRLRGEHNAELFHKPSEIKGLIDRLTEVLLELRPAAGVARTKADRESRRSRRQPRKRSDATGSLTDKPLGAVLLEHLDSSASGVLEVKRGKVTKEITLVAGHPTAVKSNVRSETLGHFLLGKGVISMEQHTAAVARAAQGGERIGAALIALGCLTPEQLIDELADQVRFKIRQSLRWKTGSWAFRKSEKQENRAVEHPIAEVVVEGLRATSEVSPLPEHLFPFVTGPISLNARGREILQVIARTVDAGFADTWQPGMDATQLVEAGLHKLQIFTTLDILSWCGGLDASHFDPQKDADKLAVFQEPLDVRDLSKLSKRAQTEAPVSRAQADDTSGLYGELFDGPDTSTNIGASPVSLGSSDSGVVDISGLESKGKDERSQARRQLLREFLRVQGIGPYDVLLVPHSADATTISAALAERRSKFSRDYFARFDLGDDQQKLDQLHLEYDRAARTLLDDAARKAHDSETRGTDQEDRKTALAAELAYRSAQELGAMGKFKEALVKLDTAVKYKPEDATYHAALGWCRYLADGRSAKAADAALPHINQALALDGDCPEAHDCKGIICSEMGSQDVEAALHLERALALDPTRLGALAALEAVQKRRGQIRALERSYRKLVYRAAESDPGAELLFWRKLGLLYRDELGDPQSAAVAFRSALRLSPEDRDVLELVQSVAEGGPSAEDEFSTGDETFINASIRVAEDAASSRDEKVYRERRGHDLVEIPPLDEKAWNQLAHPEDSVLLGLFFELIEPTLARHVGQSAQKELQDAIEINEADIPDPVRRVRDQVARTLSVKPPAIYAKPDFGREMHVIPATPPALLAGDDTLSEPEPGELAFRIGRAMTFLRPGRAIASAQPGRFLKAVFLSAWTALGTGSPVQDPSTLGPLYEDFEALSVGKRTELAAIIMEMTSGTTSLNLSKWQRSLSFTANRVGLLLADDLPQVVRFLKQTGPASAYQDVLRFAKTDIYRDLRRNLGLDDE